MEIRVFRAEQVDADDGDKLSGVLAPFNSETTIGRLDKGGWREEIAPGAFKKAIKEGDTVLLCDHDMSKPLARVSAGTLHLRETEKGLEFNADVAPTSYAKDLLVNVRAGNKGGMSIGFDPIKDEWFDDDGKPATRMTGTRRVLREVRLPEGSCVTNPAYKDTPVFARDESAALLEARQRAEEGDPRATEDLPEEDRGPKPYGNVPYADPKNGKYPIDRAHVKAAWAYINQAKNAAKYPLNGVSLASVKARIRAAMKKFGFTSGSAGRAAWEFYSAEWRDDDPYLDDWYEIDAEDFEEDEANEEPKSAENDRQRYANLAAKLVANLTGRSEDNIPTAIDLGEGQGFCIFLRDDRDDPDGHEYHAIDTAARHLTEEPPNVEAALSVLQANQALRSDQEPEASTPEDEGDDDLALHMQMRSREFEIDSI